MRSPTAALLWEIGCRRRRTIAMIAGLTVCGRMLEWSSRGSRAEPTPLTTLLGMLAFLLLFGIFNYTESSGSRGLGQFPRRLFTLPVSSLRLVAVPVLTGIVAIELLYLLWREPLSRGGSTSPLFVGVLLAGFMVFYQTALWTLERAGPLRLAIIGAAAIVAFAIGLLPSFPPTPPPVWRSEIVIALMVTTFAIALFLLSWTHIARLRAGGGRGPRRFEAVIARAADALPRRAGTFASPAAAQFWFEWRSSGLALPVLVGGVLLVVVAPLSWMVRSEAGDTMRLLLGTLATPIVLSVPVGMAFAKPTFWSEELSLPASVAALPLTTDDLVAVKVKVAAVSVALSWLFVVAFLGMWLSFWANLDSVSRLAIQLWAFHGRSVAAVYGIAVLTVIAGIFLTWRFLVSRLWSGLSGSRTVFVGSVMSVVLVAIAAAAFDAGRLAGWLLEDPARLAPVVWIGAVAVIAKYWFAAYAWRRVAPRYVRQYMPVWLAGTTCFVTLALVVWGVVRIYVPLDIYRLQSAAILFALLAVPLGRVGIAPSCLARNRHRSS